MKSTFFEKDRFYIIRANEAGVFMAKIEEIDGRDLLVKSARRLYYWTGALDVTQIAADGVASSGNKFSVQLSDDDKSVIANFIEFHPASARAIQSIQSVPAWKS